MPTTAELAAMIQGLQDEKDVIRTLDNYCRHSDFNYVEGLLDCFLEDGEWLSSIGLTLRGRGEIRDWLVNKRNPSNLLDVGGHGQGRRLGQHYRTNTIVTLQGDEAEAVSYFAQLAPDGDRVSVMVTGRYFDHLVRCDDGIWRYKIHRTESESHDQRLHVPLERRSDSDRLGRRGKWEFLPDSAAVFLNASDPDQL